MEKGVEKTSGILDKLRYALASAALFCVLGFHSPQEVSAQQKEPFAFQSTKDSLHPKKEPTERQRIDALKAKFYHGRFGVHHLMDWLDGAESTVWDYLLFGDITAGLLDNIGFRDTNIAFVKYKKVPGTYAYPIGYIKHYVLSERVVHDTMQRRVQSLDSVRAKIDSLAHIYAQRTMGDSIADAISLALMEDINRVVVDSSSIKYFQKNLIPSDQRASRKETFLKLDVQKYLIKCVAFTNTATDELFLLPELATTGDRREYYNFDLVYDWTEELWKKVAGRYDIRKRPISKYTPPEIAKYVLANFDCNNNDSYYEQERCIAKKPNGEIFRFFIGENEHWGFRYFGDVYFRDTTSQDPYNTIWHNVFQDDRAGNQQYLLLTYGVKGRTMPTVLPSFKKQPTKFVGVVPQRENETDVKKYMSKGRENTWETSTDDLLIITVNGRLLDPYLYEYKKWRFLITLNDDGIVDGVYVAHTVGARGLTGIYVYCGEHSLQSTGGQTGGAVGRAVLKKVEDVIRQWELENQLAILESQERAKEIEKMKEAEKRKATERAYVKAHKHSPEAKRAKEVEKAKKAQQKAELQRQKEEEKKKKIEEKFNKKVDDGLTK